MIDLIRQIDFNEVENHFKPLHIGVVGDVMLDVYHEGIVSRISPEAPVPIVDIKVTEMKPGGAANVCKNIRSLGASCSIFGAIGNDQAGRNLLKLMKHDHINIDGLFVVNDRPTTTKTRILSDSHQLLRLDYEEKKWVSDQVCQHLIRAFRNQANILNAVIFQDYNKGLLSPAIITSIIEICHENHIPIFVDPKFENCQFYHHVFLFKPNRKEAENLLRITIDSQDSACMAARKIREIIHAENILITLGEEGMVLLEASDICLKIPTRARKIHDVTGAGDTVISTVALFSAAGYSLQTSTVMANLAAGRVCEEIGIIPITLTALKEMCQTFV
ncbi:MAG: D-glycero-beta-D-manno-heptose-7-phosphate kinase [Candidatus Marinimicrobia bacterium]|nr:D-glycero-beta-D-manno-heptose-7-phosphate kinase [Candidatus Neomarinimicrobiota bacterium]